MEVKYGESYASPACGDEIYQFEACELPSQFL